MNDKFDELAKGLAQSVTRRGTPVFLCLAIAAQLALLARASDLRLGPISDLSDPDVFAGCGSNGSEKECSIAVNPVNPKNLVSAWIGGRFKGIGAAVSLDGGKCWQQVIIPGLSFCHGGTQDFDSNSDPWLSFAPDGGLDFICVADGADRRGIVTSKSSDGGLSWSAPVFLSDTADKRFFGDKPVIAADRTAAGFVYAIWGIDANGNRGQIVFSRSTDGGRTWDPARFVYDRGVTDNSTTGSSLVIRPDGTLVYFFSENKFPDGGTHKGAVASVIRSTDKGLTWSAPIAIASIPVFSVVDPETGKSVVNSSSSFPNFGAAVDPNNGNLYAAWEDTGFSNGQYSSIAFSMSSDGGFSWSAPIPVNRTPGNIAVANWQAFIPAVAVAADGTIGVTYYDFRFNDARPGMLTDYWLVHCHPSAKTPANNAASWTSEVRLTGQSFDIERVAPGDVYFIGDYQGLASVGSEFLPVWSQPHDNDFNSIYFRRAGP
jgi:hypothetical protein